MRWKRVINAFAIAFVTAGRTPRLTPETPFALWTHLPGVRSLVHFRKWNAPWGELFGMCVRNVWRIDLQVQCHPLLSIGHAQRLLRPHPL